VAAVSVASVVKVASVANGEAAGVVAGVVAGEAVGVVAGEAAGAVVMVSGSSKSYLGNQSV
jgi:hypothetical protein